MRTASIGRTGRIGHIPPIVLPPSVISREIQEERGERGRRENIGQHPSYTSYLTGLFSGCKTFARPAVDAPASRDDQLTRLRLAA